MGRSKLAADSALALLPSPRVRLGRPTTRRAEHPSRDPLSRPAAPVSCPGVRGSLRRSRREPQTDLGSIDGTGAIPRAMCASKAVPATRSALSATDVFDLAAGHRRPNPPPSRARRRQALRQLYWLAPDLPPGAALRTLSRGTAGRSGVDDHSATCSPRQAQRALRSRRTALVRLEDEWPLRRCSADGRDRLSGRSDAARVDPGRFPPGSRRRRAASFLDALVPRAPVLDALPDFDDVRAADSPRARSCLRRHGFDVSGQGIDELAIRGLRSRSPPFTEPRCG